MAINPKQIIVETAKALGFHSAAVASLDPLHADKLIYQAWLDNGYAASMEYLKRNPEKRNSPQLLCPEAYSAVMLSASYYTEVPPDPGPQYGRVARYAVGRDYHEVLPAKLAELKSIVEDKLQRPLLGKYFTDDVELFEQALGKRHGLGFVGKHSLLIGPRLSGSYHFVAEFFTDLEMEADLPYQGTCGNCFRCGSACPTEAIVAEQMVDANRCISFLTIENKKGIPLDLRKKVGNWLFGCDVCQEVCPYNQRPPETSWIEFRPISGVGHYLDLFEILAIRDKKDFLAKFAHTPLSRPKRRGLVRNALVVISNRLPEGGDAAVFQLLNFETDEMLFEHGLWCLSQYDGSSKLLRELYDKWRGHPLQDSVREHLEKN